MCIEVSVTTLLQPSMTSQNAHKEQSITWLLLSKQRNAFTREYTLLSINANNVGLCRWLPDFASNIHETYNDLSPRQAEASALK